MAERRESIHGLWSSRLAFVLAATGSAVGLGNIWKFPYITGENGGGAFVFVYLICILIIGIPVMMGEILIGRRGRQNPASAIASLAEESGAPTAWSIMGLVGILSSFLILTFYVVVAGWSFAYIFITAGGAFKDASTEVVGEEFGQFLGSWKTLLTWSTVVVALCMFTVAGGVRKGIERAVTTLMPGMLVILLILVGYALSTDAFSDGLRFLFAPDFSKLTADGVLIALGHAFFTLSLASGVMIAYGAYLPSDASIFRTTLAVAAADTAIALLAGLAIFPIVFQYELTPSEGPGLIFTTLPIAFGKMPYGTFFGTLFFLMLSLAAFTSAISLLEPTTALLMERLSIGRVRAVVGSGVVLWVLSLASVFSFNLWSDVTFFRGTMFDNIDYVTANIMLPLGGLLVAVFTAWIMKPADTQDELGMDGSRVYPLWQFVMRFVAPVAIIAVFLNAIGVLRFSAG